MLSPGQSDADTHIRDAGADLDHGLTSNDARSGLAVVDLPPGHTVLDTQCEAARGTNLAEGQTLRDAQTGSALGSNLPPTNEYPTPTRAASAASISDPGQRSIDAQVRVAGVDLHDALLAILAGSLDDLERTRIATQNRLRAIRDDHGLAGTPWEARLNAMAEAIAAAEHQATLDLQKAMRLHPLGEHVKATKGLGLKQAARLLAAIGNPADRPNPAKLWQYAGHGDPARSRKRKGQTVEFNPTAKMRVHLCAESCMKQMQSPYRAVYDRERAKWADRETSDGHKHNHALRVVGKHILLDLWKAARA